MCVIAIVRDKRPDEEIVRAMFEANSAGAGVAWRASSKGKDVVRWTKGIHEIDEVVQLNESLIDLARGCIDIVLDPKCRVQ